ncbi:MAG: response regulator transcription factor [Bacteroidetes bacterium]|nr:response regulator transcription factor [Bacteroidota bacterium]
MKLRCLIVDDEPLSVKVVQKYVEKLPQLELVAVCYNAFEAMEVLQKNEVDVLFLDINMPQLSGISLMKALPHPPAVVFITAYPEYAVEGFELEAVDYLLKPFSFERFIKAVQKVQERLNWQQNHTVNTEESDHLIIKVDKKLYRLRFPDIQYLQAYGDYVKVFATQETLLTKERLSNLEEMLPNEQFLRIHRSYIISLNAIQFIEGNQVQIGTTKLPVGQKYRESLLNWMQMNPKR